MGKNKTELKLEKVLELIGAHGSHYLICEVRDALAELETLTDEEIDRIDAAAEGKLA